MAIHGSVVFHLLHSGFVTLRFCYTRVLLHSGFGGKYAQSVAYLLLTVKCGQTNGTLAAATQLLPHN